MKSAILNFVETKRNPSVYEVMEQFGQSARSVIVELIRSSELIRCKKDGCYRLFADKKYLN